MHVIQGRGVSAVGDLVGGVLFVLYETENLSGLVCLGRFVWIVVSGWAVYVG